MTASLLSRPESQGLSSRAVLRFLDGCQKAGLQLHAFELRRYGHTLAQGAWSPFRLGTPHALYSVSKSFVSTAVGFAVSEGLFGLDDPVLMHFPEEAPPVVSAHLVAMRVRDLLTMTTGHAEDLMGTLYASQPQPWTQTFLAQPVQHPPGTHFVYNSAATYMLAALVERLSGQRMLDYLEPRLFTPLSITGATWETNATGETIGGWGLRVPVGALAQLGQLYLQGGMWEGRQLLPAGWAEQATSAQVSNGDADAPGANDGAQGYGFQFWRCRHGAYRADGAFGQFSVVMPEQQAVLAIVSSVDNMQAVMDQIWAHLLPAFQGEPLQGDTEAAAELQARCEGLAIPVLTGEHSSPSAVLLGGRSFTFDPNIWGLEQVGFGEIGAEVPFTLTYSHGRYEHHAGFVGWAEHSTSGLLVGTTFQTPTQWAGTAAWTRPDTLQIHLLDLGDTKTLTLNLRPLDDGNRLEVEAAFVRAFRQDGSLSMVGTRQG
ncbi:serine hydrolase (plasmid) [Deinococcus radiomollis]|uniref:serine hydrolase domain-containing protein n=1 Tax=Deinococcus radiomollis TaxID=468916 RepID=UPI0038929773